MEDLKEGDLLVHEDGTEWIFIKYATGKITVSIEFVEKNDWRGKSIFDKSIVYVEPLDPDEHKMRGQKNKSFPAREFKKLEQ